jgi:hypothetical protein
LLEYLEFSALELFEIPFDLTLLNRPHSSTFSQIAGIKHRYCLKHALQQILRPPSMIAVSVPAGKSGDVLQDPLPPINTIF